MHQEKFTSNTTFLQVINESWNYRKMSSLSPYAFSLFLCYKIQFFLIFPLTLWVLIFWFDNKVIVWFCLIMYDILILAVWICCTSVYFFSRRWFFFLGCHLFVKFLNKYLLIISFIYILNKKMSYRPSKHFWIRKKFLNPANLKIAFLD